MRFLVTGADGFIGYTLAKRLDELGHDVTAFLYKDGNRPRSSFELKARTITGDVRSMADIEKTGKVDGIFHLAANADPKDFGTNMMETNVLGTVNILEFARKHGAKLVFSSSAAVYGNLPAPQKEEGPMAPNNAYGFTKAVSELFCRAHAAEHGTEVIMLRYFNTYGVGEEVKGRDASMVYHFMQSILRGDTIELYGDGSQSRDFIYVKDVVRANIMAMEKKGLSGQSLNVGTGRTTNFKELVGIIAAKAGMEAKVKCVPNPLKNAYQFNTMAELSNSSAKLGFRPSYVLEDGVAEMVKNYSSNAAKS